MVETPHITHGLELLKPRVRGDGRSIRAHAIHPDVGDNSY